MGVILSALCLSFIIAILARMNVGNGEKGVLVLGVLGVALITGVINCLLEAVKRVVLLGMIALLI